VASTRLIPILLLLACRTAGGPPPAPIPAPDPTPAWQLRLQDEVSALRGLRFKRPVRYGVQSRQEFRGFVRAELDRELPPAHRTALSRSYAQMGFVAEGFDLTRALEDALTTQVAAYYDPHQRSLFVLGGKRPAGDAVAKGDEVIAHELQHALQDQHFDLVEFDGGEGNARGLDDDQKTARHFVAEGEAMFVMLAWQMGSGAGAARRLGPLAVAGLRMSVTMLAAADMLDLLSFARQGENADLLPADERADLEALLRLPPVIAVPLIDPYLKGALLVSEVWGRGGWPAVDELFRHPPDSTEQALHPVEKYLTRDPPVHIQAAPLPPVLKGATLLSSEVLGELGWRIYFKTCQQPDGDRAAAGWGGDRYWSYQLHGRPVVLTATRWDSEAEAREFFDAYVATLERRFPRPPAPRHPTVFGTLRPNGGGITIERSGRDVDIIDGASGADLLPLRDFLRAASRR
jgi:hypothetical protein